ncbi:MAG: HIT domain-containing protein [Candidatus Omnitrophica bacterium]|nr:HIT domain-containing protein [Candidatus Omnitrophota bacterium]
MERLWAPWRKTYIRNKKVSGCVFCRALQASPKKDPENFILLRSSHNFIILNRYPYISGHLMVVPNRHVDSLEKLGDRARLDFLALLDQGLAALKRALKPQGFNVGLNLGRVGGAGVRKHIHLHLVPRWGGDTNFMPLLAGTRVLSDTLRSTYKELVNALK